MVGDPTTRSAENYAREVFWTGPQGQLVGLSTESKPTARPDGTPLRPGVEFLEWDTQRAFVLDGMVWRPKPLPEPAAGVGLGDLLAELQAIRKGVELALALTHGVHVDLLTERVTEVA